MPIDSEALSRAAHRHLVMQGSHSVLDAIAKLGQQGGQEWWHLIVNLGGGKFAAGPFASLRAGLQSEGEAYLHKALADIGLTAVQAVEQDSLSTREAEARVESSPGNVLLVTRQGKLQGILVVGPTRGVGEVFATSSLLELAGNYVDLSAYRDELLGDDDDDEKKADKGDKQS